jgi:SulP family sulfate permease
VLALCVGAAALVAGLLRLGFLASLISEPVLKGFVAGLALTIIVGQVPKLLGVDSGDGDFFEKPADLLDNLGSTDALTLAVGWGTLVLVLVLVLGLRRVAPGVPGSLVAVALGTALVEIFSLQDHGLDIVGLPDAKLSDYGALAPGRSA